ncbi:MAG: pro-sigmaK processing inhibitor BofA family protein [Methanoregula sp.]|jgi:inhibitor of the pro-sigma K processing machinery
MTDVLVTLLLVVAIIATVYFLVKKFSVLVINAILGLIALFFLNFLHVMQWMGKPDPGYSIATVIICAVGGLPGICVLILLDILGITI